MTVTDLVHAKVKSTAIPQFSPELIYSELAEGRTKVRDPFCKNWA